MSILTANLTGDHRIGYKTSELESKYAATGFACTKVQDLIPTNIYASLRRLRFVSFDFAIFYRMGFHTLRLSHLPILLLLFSHFYPCPIIT
jgi:hypothetical protein